MHNIELIKQYVGQTVIYDRLQCSGAMERRKGSIVRYGEGILRCLDGDYALIVRSSSTGAVRVPICHVSPRQLIGV